MTGSSQPSYVRSVAILSAGFFGIFMAFNTAQALETTIVSKDLADISLASLYACFTVAAVVAPKVVQVLDPRLAMIVGAIPYVLLVFSNIKPGYALTLPAFILVGFSAAVLWTAQGIYVGRCALRHARATGEKEGDVTSRFNGIFFTAFQFNGCIGTLIASSIQRSMGESDFERANKSIFLAFGIAAAVGVSILCFLQSAPPLDTDAGESAPLTRALPDAERGLSLNTTLESSERGAAGADAVTSSSSSSSSSSISLYETLRLVFQSKAMVCLLPIIFYNGMSLGYFFSDYPDFYASQSTKARQLLSKDMVGFVTATFYFANSLASFFFGSYMAKLGRRNVMVLAALIHIAVYVVIILALTTFTLEPGTGFTYFLVFVLSVAFAVGDSVWESQIPALVQNPSFFPAERDRDAAMSNVKMWQSLGFALQFAIGFLLDVYWAKVIIIGGLQIIALACLLYLNTSVQSLDNDGNAGSGGGNGSGSASSAGTKKDRSPQLAPERGLALDVGAGGAAEERHDSVESFNGDHEDSSFRMRARESLLPRTDN